MKLTAVNTTNTDTTVLPAVNTTVPPALNITNTTAPLSNTTVPKTTQDANLNMINLFDRENPAGLNMFN
eukprot:CAMPEP_0194381262 /NCGR_PEP_ID=MMETSP0174-20130528/51681_1 /TAXON_ID=216777 /ORGANISM="Proboscia alata, Strain PI-D3" /LENGTH=68 /DNA_ID=CAMNT_0039165435 /DNA_START=245 /DNA_END=451 /DNA_ORIENTATION=-